MITKASRVMTRALDFLNFKGRSAKPLVSGVPLSSQSRPERESSSDSTSDFGLPIQVRPFELGSADRGS